MNLNNRKRVKRKKRKGEHNCFCGAYPFPHRMLGGDCDGSYFVYNYFSDQLCGSCLSCHHRSDNGEEVQCQVLEGLEPIMQCPGLRDYVRYHSIKLYNK